MTDTRDEKRTRWTKRPVTVEAVRLTAADFNWGEGWDGLPFDPTPQWVLDAVEDGTLVPGTPRNTDYSEWRVMTLEGEYWGTPGDWLIRGVEGKLYFCKPDIFEATYERADPSGEAGEEDEDFDEFRESHPYVVEAWDKLQAYVRYRAFGADDIEESRDQEWTTTALRLDKLGQRIRYLMERDARLRRTPDDTEPAHSYPGNPAYPVEPPSGEAGEEDKIAEIQARNDRQMEEIKTSDPRWVSDEVRAMVNDVSYLLARLRCTREE